MPDTINTVEIMPTPRILRTLGEIPFKPWQCLAELIDNSIDAFLADENKGKRSREQRIVVSWSSDSVASGQRTVEISDNATGMTFEQIQNAVRAGYSSNDPIGNLGLFGMGFNIATARLGEQTTILSATEGDTEWVGLTIDFSEMIKSKQFTAPIERRPKTNRSESGTWIIVSKLRTGIRDELSVKENEIRKQLESIYTPLLNDKDIIIMVKGTQLFPRNHCVWSAVRYVMYKDQTVPAYIEIDRDLGASLFDLERNEYLTPDMAEPYYIAIQNGESLPGNLVERNKRLTGWLGVQRYADPNDYGIDFIRNGRKILISDKSLFHYENPYTGQKDLQYPVELGTSIGGRIVGELNVDYLLPTYQKNDFDRSDNSWLQTIDAICGAGPFLPKSRKGLGFPEATTSPLGVLVNAYRRIDQGTKCLFAPNDKAKQFAVFFRGNKQDYISDNLWWQAAQEEDQKRSSGGTRATTPVNPGSTPSDDPDEYLGETATNGSDTTTGQPTTPTQPQQSPEETSTLDSLIQNSKSIAQLNGKYGYDTTAPLEVRAYELHTGRILLKGHPEPCHFSSEGMKCSFVYDPKHPLIAQFPLTPKLLLLQYLAEKLKARDGVKDIISAFSQLVETNMPEARIEKQNLQERAMQVFSTLREKLIDALKPYSVEALECVHESSGEVEETVNQLLSNPDLLVAFQQKTENGLAALEYVPERTLLRLVDRFPQHIFDGVVFNAPYILINLVDEKATERSRAESKDRIISLLKDAMHLATSAASAAKDKKNELARASISVDFLMDEL